MCKVNVRSQRMALKNSVKIFVSLLLFFGALLSKNQVQADNGHFKPIGCYKDSRGRAFPKLLANFRSEITDWSNFDAIINACSELSRQKGYRYFGIQFYGECWSGEDVEFDKEGRSFRCIKGVGRAASNFVYENIHPNQGADECGVKPPQSRIIGGTTALFNEWPWQAEILMLDTKQNKFVHRCGGTLINKWWIVTAAHCVFQNIDPKIYKIRLGEHDRSRKEPGEMELPVSVVQIHNRFFTNNYGYDIAMMKLAAPAIINPKVLPACLPKLYQQVEPGRNCFVTGWGMTKYKGPHATVLQQAKLPLVSDEQCAAVNGALREVDKFTMLCAGYGGNSSISGCHGDSGGPFVCQEDGGRWFLRGIVSWGDNECKGKSYSVFARVSSFVEWIDYHMIKEPLKRPTGCTDAHFYCKEWKAKGYCDYSYFDHMLKGYYCKKTCGACHDEV